MKKYRGWILAAVVALVCVGAFVWFQGAEDRAWTALTEKITALPTTATAEDLEREGFLNLSKDQTALPKEIQQFIQGQNRLLTFFLETEDGPLVHVFSVNDDKLLNARTYSVSQGQWQFPNRLFVFQITYSEGTDGLTEVWIHDSTTPTREDPIPSWTEFLLCRYQK